MKQKQEAIAAPRKSARKRAVKVVADPSAGVSRRQTARDKAARAAKASAKRMAPLLASDGGAEGMQVHTVGVRISATRTDHREMRAMPGSFAWRYGRKSADLVLFHAGSTLERLWETAGVAAAKSPDLENAATRGGGAGGASLARLNAMDQLRAVARAIGEGSASRLFYYLGKGNTAREVGRLFNVSERAMAFVLHQDLVDLARHFRFLAKPEERGAEGRMRAWNAPDMKDKAG